MRSVLCCQAALPHAYELAHLLVTTRGMSPACTVCLGGKALVPSNTSNYFKEQACAYYHVRVKMFAMLC